MGRSRSEDSVPPRLVGTVNGGYRKLGRYAHPTLRRGSFSFRSYQSESAGNPVGGEVHKFRYTHNIALGSLWTWTDWSASAIPTFLRRHLSVPGTVCRTIFLTFFRYSRFTDIKRYGSSTWQLNIFFEKKLDIVAGRINALDDFATSPLYCFAQNLGFCGNPLSIPANASVSELPGRGLGSKGALRSLK